MTTVLQMRRCLPNGCVVMLYSSFVTCKKEYGNFKMKSIIFDYEANTTQIFF